MSEQTFLSHLRAHFEKIPPQDPLRGVREKSWEKLAGMQLPTRSHEAFGYVTLRECYLSTFQFPAQSQIDKASLEKFLLPESLHSHLVFVDGIFSAELSDLSALPEQILLLTLQDALKTHGSFLQSHLARSIKEESDPFAMANLALHGQGVFLYLPPKLESAAPLQCLSVHTGKEACALFPRLHLVLGAQSTLRMISTSHAFDGDVPHLVVPLMEAFLEEGATLDHVNWIEGNPAWHLESLRASLKRNARLNAFHMTFGGKVVRHSYRVFLKGENSEVNLSGLWMLGENRTAHTHAIVEHEAPHTRSMQQFKGVLTGFSQSSFEGKILVRPEAQKTEAYQLNNNLILSQGAQANSKPNLEVFADDVKASHGATVSQLDTEQLFYLQTRGIAPAAARRLLIGGFCREMIEKIGCDSLVEKIEAIVDTFVVKE